MLSSSWWMAKVIHENEIIRGRNIKQKSYLSRNSSNRGRLPSGGSSSCPRQALLVGLQEDRREDRLAYDWIGWVPLNRQYFQFPGNTTDRQRFLMDYSHPSALLYFNSNYYLRLTLPQKPRLRRQGCLRTRKAPAMKAILSEGGKPLFSCAIVSQSH